MQIILGSKMHELTIAMEILEIADDYAKKANSNIAAEIEIEVGELSGVEFDALDFALEISKKNTVIENANINIKKIKGKAKCNICTKEFEIDNLYSICPFCNQNNFTVIDGKQLKVKTITFE
jgi:hydrogenase nickel incorporation protein HypA/HybF